MTIAPAHTEEPLSIADVAEQTGLPEDVATLLHLLFSRLLGHYRHSRSPVHQIAGAVAQLCRLEYEDGDRMILAPHAALTGPWSSAESTFHKLKPLGITPDSLTEMWEEAEAASLSRPLLPLEIVVAFFPLRLWAPMATVVSWGADETQRRMSMYERQERVRKIQPTRARPNGGRVAASTVSLRLGLLRGLMKRLNEMVLNGVTSPLLEDWRTLPPAPRRSETRGEELQATDRSGPALTLCRRALRQLDADIRDRLRVKRRRENLLRFHRKRLWLALLLSHGTRKRALASAEVGSYVPDYPFLDGVRRPALCIDPRKSLPAGAYRYKVLPPQIEEWLLIYLDYVGYAVIGRDADGTPRRDANGRIAECEVTVPANTPLWVGGFEKHEDGTRTAKPLEIPAGTIGNTVAGVSSKDPRKRMRPLIPHLKATDEGHGYSSHALRHATHHLASRVGFDIKEANPERFGHWRATDFGDALLDHKFPNAYADQEGANRELASCLATLGIWELLWTDKGARRAPDYLRQHNAHAALVAATAAYDLAERRVEELDQERGNLHEKELPALDTTELNSAQLAQGVAELLAAMADAWSKLGRIDHELVRANRTVVESARGLARAEAEVEAARLATVAVDDLAPDPDQTIMQEQPPATTSCEPELARGYVLCAEAAHAFEVPESTMRRWFAGKLPRELRTLGHSARSRHPCSDRGSQQPCPETLDRPRPSRSRRTRSGTRTCLRARTAL